MSKLTVSEAKKTIVFFIREECVESDTLLNFVNESIDETTTPRGVAPRVFIEKEEVRFYGEDIISENEHGLEREDYNSDQEFNLAILEEHVETLSISLNGEMGNIRLSDFEYYEPGDEYYFEYYVISTWGIGGNNYHSGKYEWSNCFRTEEEANDELFNRTYKYDFCNDCNRDTRYWLSEENAYDQLIEDYANNNYISEATARSIFHHRDIADQIKEDRRVAELILREENKARIEAIAKQYAKMINYTEGESYKETAARLSNTIGGKIEKPVFHKAVKMVRNSKND